MLVYMVKKLVSIYPNFDIRSYGEARLELSG